MSFFVTTNVQRHLISRKTLGELRDQAMSFGRPLPQQREKEFYAKAARQLVLNVTTHFASLSAQNRHSTRPRALMESSFAWR